MTIITCASYYGTGSSALTDLVSEYTNVKNLTSFEFRFLHDLDGVRDLEYHLVENHNRHNSGHALKRFNRLMQFNAGNFISHRYSMFIEKTKYKSLVNNYVESLTDFTINSWWFYDLYDKGYKSYYLFQIANHIFQKIPFGDYGILKKEKTFCSHPSEDNFLHKTRRFVSSFLRELNSEDAKYLCVDQIVPCSNIKTVLRYFEDTIYVFIVDRDPRDIYFSQKYFLKESPVPTNSVEEFIEWFRYSRESGNEADDANNIIKIRFEDLIYKYDESKRKIEGITGLCEENHTYKYDKLNPKRSVVNTQVFLKFTSEEDIRDRLLIEKYLHNYLYDFESVKCNEIYGKDTTEHNVF